MTEVVVVTGTGGMGIASARRLGAGRQLVIADVDDAKLDREAAILGTDGFAVNAVSIDVSERAAVEHLVEVAGRLGTLRTVVHTAGLSPAQAAPERLLAVDVFGTEHVLDCFLELVTEGTVAVCIASIAGYLATIPPAQETRLRHAAVSEFAAAVERARAGTGDPTSASAYSFAKRINQLRVEHHARPWGARGGRVVSVSPGIISTPMGRLEFEGAPDALGAAVGMQPVSRIGTAEDIAAAVEWLAGATASFVTGCDVRVDGGVIAAVGGLGSEGNPLLA
jgi:NAD(P)-dependent dehydrogenase (short-subunit alcohol dehydrogenase family)